MTVSTLGLSFLYVYVFREYCLQLIMYSVGTQGVVERIINVLYYYDYLLKKIIPHNCNTYTCD